MDTIRIFVLENSFSVDVDSLGTGWSWNLKYTELFDIFVTKLSIGACELVFVNRNTCWSVLCRTYVLRVNSSQRICMEFEAMAL